MMPHHPTDHSNDILMIVLGIFIQAGIWLTDLFAHITVDGVYELIFNAAKLGALIASIWASIRVAKKNKND